MGRPMEPQPVRPFPLTSRDPSDRMKELTERLEQGIRDVFQNRQYQKYLQVMARFYDYSFNNVLLIAMQKPDASLVAGYAAWQKQFGRYVKKGEKGIKILAPMFRKMKKEEESRETAELAAEQPGEEEKTEKILTGFKVVSVFDISQTEGKELPTYGVPMLQGDVEGYAEFFQAAREISPVPVSFETIQGEAHGYYHQMEKRIAVAEGMSELQNVKTLLHEIAHAKLHAMDPDAPEGQETLDRHTKEVQAESIAYVVCQHYGLDTSEYSFAYVAGWSSGKELPELRSSLETIRGTAREMITGIDIRLSLLREQKKQERKNENERVYYRNTGYQEMGKKTEGKAVGISGKDKRVHKR